MRTAAIIIFLTCSGAFGVKYQTLIIEMAEEIEAKQLSEGGKRRWTPTPVYLLHRRYFPTSTKYRSVLWYGGASAMFVAGVIAVFAFVK